MWRERRVQFKILKDRNRRKLVWKYENSKSLGNSWVLLAGMSKNTSEYHLACEGKKKIQKAYFPYMGESDCPWIWFKLSLLSSIRVPFTKFHFHCFISHLLSTKAELAESRPTTPEANHHRDPGNSHSMFLLFSQPEHSHLSCAYMKSIQLSEIRKDPASPKKVFL